MGKAVVASPQALEGLDVVPGTHVLAAATPGEWVEALLHLFDDPALRRRLGEAGRRFVEERHDWGRCLEPFAALLGLTGDRGSADIPSPAPRAEREIWTS